MAASRSGSNDLRQLALRLQRRSFSQRSVVLDSAHRASAASSVASASSRVSKSCKAFSAVASRPAALRRGPRRKPISSAAIGARTAATSINFRMPGAWIARFQQCRAEQRCDFRSATERCLPPSQARPDRDSPSSRILARPRLEQRVAKLKNNADAAKVMKRAIAFRSFGFTTATQSGKADFGSW